MEGPSDNRDRSRGPLFSSRRMERSRQQRQRLLAGLATVVVLALGVAGWWTWKRSHPAAAPAPALPATPAPAPDTAAAPVADQPIDLPELDASDELVRRSVAGLSARPDWAAWLVTDDMIRRFVVAVVAVAEGRSPEAQLRFLVPKTPFSVRRQGGRTVVDPGSYERYDVAVATFASLDTEGVARLYRQMHPIVEDAYRELGLRDRSFDETLAGAIDNLLALNVPDAAPAVEEDEGQYVFSAPGTEALSPAEKHLLRMGPANARLVQEKLREIARALGLTR